MPDRILFPEFRDQLEHTRYPFADGTTLATQTTKHVIDVDTFLDASLYPIGATSRLHILKINVTSRLVTIVLSDATRQPLASGSFDPLDPPSQVVFTDAYERPAGILVSEPIRLARFSAWAIAEHAFALGAAEFAAGCVIPLPAPGVRGVLTDKNELFTGDLWIVGDRGVVVREEDGDIRVDLVGSPLFVRELCDPVGLFNVPNFIRTINGCPPDANGNFNLTVGDHLSQETIVRIYAVDGVLVVEGVGSLVRSK